MARSRTRVTVDLEGLDDLLDTVRRHAAALEPPTVTEAVVDAAGVYRDGARRRAPGPVSGRLRDSIQARPVSATSAVAETDLHYAWVHELGATIVPVRARALRFEVDGRVVFARKVVIPARPYFVPTFDQDTDRAFGAFADRIDQHITG